MKLERRYTPSATVKLEQRVDGQPPIISGYAAVHYDGTPDTEYELWDSLTERVIERIMPGTFANALARGDDAACLFNHNPDLLLGRVSSGTVKLSTDVLGLRYSCTPGNTTIASDLIVHLGRQDVKGSSFAFSVDGEKWTESKSEAGKWLVVREINDVTLADVSPCVNPAYTSTTAGVRNAADADEARKAHAAHRAAQSVSAQALASKLSGYSRRARLLQIEQTM